MSNRVGAISTIGLSAALMACTMERIESHSAASAETATLSSVDVAAVKTIIDEYVRTTLAADWTGFGEVLARDAIAYPPNGPPIAGRDSIVAFVKTFPKITGFTVDVTEVVGAATLAVVMGKYHLTMQLPDGSTAKDEGSFIQTHEYQAAGRWPYKRLIWHSDLPVPAPPAKTAN